jgi:ArsR family transcriptional regulator, arsenate/arsenite/antimonite-responsive transcriptional repressor
MSGDRPPLPDSTLESYLYFYYIRNMEQIDVIKALAALAQPVRLAAFRALVVAGPPGLTPGVLSEALSVPPNSLSFHLKELTHAGLTTQERQSRHIVYRADFTRMNALLAYLTDNCCAGVTCVVAANAACCDS